MPQKIVCNISRTILANKLPGDFGYELEYQFPLNKEKVGVPSINDYDK